MKNKTKTLWIVLSIALLLTVSVGGTLAYLSTQTSEVENTFEPSEVKCKVDESFNGTVKSKVSIQNTGNTDAYIRAAIVVTWKDAVNGNVYPEMPKAGEDYTITIKDAADDNWTKGGDGFWYYEKAVAPGESTDVLIESCAPVANETPAGYGLNVEILAQAIQAEGDAVAGPTNWTITPVTAGN